MRKLEDSWHPFRTGKFGSEELATFLTAAHSTFDPESFAGQFGRTLVSESIDRRPVGIALLEAGRLPTNQRIDGALPLVIPSRRNASILVEELFEEAEVNGLRLPAEDRIDSVRRDLVLCYFALLHGRTLLSSHRLEITMKVECPFSATGHKEELTLMGHLPLGGAISLFTTPLKGDDWSTHSGSALAHLKKLKACRLEEGLRLIEAL